MKQLIRRLSRVTVEPVVPEGHVPVYVGDEMERFVVHAELLNHPVFVELLNKSAQEYGYEQKGVLRTVKRFQTKQCLGSSALSNQTIHMMNPSLRPRRSPPSKAPASSPPAKSPPAAAPAPVAEPPTTPEAPTPASDSPPAPPAEAPGVASPDASTPGLHHPNFDYLLFAHHFHGHTFPALQNSWHGRPWRKYRDPEDGPARTCRGATRSHLRLLHVFGGVV